MTDKLRNIIVVALAGVLIFGLSIWGIVRKPDEFSYSERRRLAQFPEVSVQNIFNEKGDSSFMMEFENYSADQFPMRDTFRRLNSVFSMYGLGKKEVNDIYVADGYAAKLEYILNEKSLDWALGRFKDVAERYLDGGKAYIVVVPDKGYYLAKDNGYPALDYEKLFETVKDGTEDFAEYIDITEFLGKDNYYRTDTHWRQETIIPVAGHIAECMGAELKADYTVNTLDKSFYGVYYGQMALPMKADTLKYLTNDILESAVVECLDEGEPESISVYDMDKAMGKDSYEIFLSGSRALITVENPKADTDKELVIFRDSFGSSIALLFVEAYSKVTVVDIRYMSPAFVGRFVDFENADVLFLYSTLVLNNSEGQLLK